MNRSRWRHGALALVILLAATLLPAAPPAQPAVILATTTSTQDSGLLDDLLPLFEKQSGYAVKTIAVGSGQAIAMGRRGEADVLLVHSPEAEEALLADGAGIRRRIVMHNDFVLLGPPGDPAGVSKRGALEGFQRIAKTRSLFLSRGDHSGTHAQELKLWKAAGITAEGQPWYQETGQGMGQTLAVASEKKAYTLSDRGTYLAMRRNISLIILHEGDPTLRNVYHVIEVNPMRFPKVNGAGARAFADFLVSKVVQKRIKEFGIGLYGSPLFFPDADVPNVDAGRR
ncbi:tungsten ABC transporter substrate-binding protein [Geothrix limicola]|uniref:Tungsten ABC transporter substrate-binding protein n=1 Tax=Geothrix limicola TaxID=2927978 RepID=A0ABQ5QK80_9BACT|nr:substrate-binding domain-containing protein [Geothrix limicola]GLH75002.1 tungsten ABC transporter substrate-binding protein [Geothrix limicola]